jgi:hypothetical protein
MAADTLHTHKCNGTQWSGIRTRTALSTVNATRLPLSIPHDLPRVQPPQMMMMPFICSCRNLLVDVVVLLALLANVHNGWRRPAHALAHRPFRSPRHLPHIVLFAPCDASRLAPLSHSLVCLLVVIHDDRRRHAHALGRFHQRPT